MSGIGWDNYNDCPLWQFTEEELEEHDKQIRADVIDEIKALAHEDVTTGNMIINLFEIERQQLKEQK